MSAKEFIDQLDSRMREAERGAVATMLQEHRDAVLDEVIELLNNISGGTGGPLAAAVSGMKGSAW
jgi:hypothetical protein